MAKEGKKQKAPRETPGQPVAVPAGPTTQTPEGVTEQYRNEGSQVISDALPQQNLYMLGPEKLRAYFVKDWETDGDKISGVFHFHGNKKFEKWMQTIINAQKMASTSLEKPRRLWRNSLREKETLICQSRLEKAKNLCYNDII